jgi:hypothetical protein
MKLEVKSIPTYLKPMIKGYLIGLQTQMQKFRHVIHVNKL